VLIDLCPHSPPTYYLSCACLSDGGSCDVGVVLYEPQSDAAVAKVLSQTGRTHTCEGDGVEEMLLHPLHRPTHSPFVHAFIRSRTLPACDDTLRHAVDADVVLYELQSGVTVTEMSGGDVTGGEVMHYYAMTSVFLGSRECVGAWVHAC